MSPESKARLARTLEAQRPMRRAPREFNRGGGGGGGHGGGFVGPGRRWGGGFYPSYGYYGYGYPQQQMQTYFDGVNIWVWNGFQWVVFPASWRYGRAILGRSGVSVAGCLGCAGVVQEDASVQNPQYHYGRWAGNPSRGAAAQLAPVQHGTWYPALSSQLMPPPPGVKTWVVWSGGATGMMYRPGLAMPQIVKVTSSRSGGPTGFEVLASPELGLAA
jgi:hypothetical protein